MIKTIDGTYVIRKRLKEAIKSRVKFTDSKLTFEAEFEWEISKAMVSVYALKVTLEQRFKAEVKVYSSKLKSDETI